MRWMLVVVLAVALLLSGCADTSVPSEEADASATQIIQAQMCASSKVCERFGQCHWNGSCVATNWDDCVKSYYCSQVTRLSCSDRSVSPNCWDCCQLAPK